MFLAEVSDKIPSIPQYLVVGAFLGLVLYAAAKCGKFAVMVASLAATSILLFAIYHVKSDDLSPAILEENGYGYFMGFFASASLPALAVVLSQVRRICGCRPA